jgi:hypothetical protein
MFNLGWERRARRMNPAAAAAYWIVRRDSRGLGPREQAAFQAWLTVEAHGRAYREVSRIWTALGEAGADSAAALGGAFQSNGNLVMKTTLARALDASAISLSALCLVHCLALPALALALPFVGAWAQAEWVHVIFIALAAPIALLALMDWRARRPHAWPLIALAGLGLGLMLVGALGFPSAAWERPLTVMGGVLLATAHVLNWRGRHAGRHDCP